MKSSDILYIKFINDQAIRGQFGGWIVPDSLSINLESSMSKDTIVSSILSKYAYYFTLGGVISGFSLLMFIGESFELIWSLVNTMQIISFLPLMISNYPEHVTILFEALQFLNMDFDILSNLFQRYFSIDSDISNLSERFKSYGIESILFFDNWSSLL